MTGDSNFVLEVTPRGQFSDYFKLTSQIGKVFRLKSVVLDKRKQCLRITLTPGTLNEESEESIENNE